MIRTRRALREEINDKKQEGFERRDK